MALWGSIKARFSQTQDQERTIRERFPHPEDQQDARKEFRQCEERIAAANRKLAEELAKKDRPDLQLNRGRFPQQKIIGQARRDANIAYKTEVENAVADRDRALRGMEDARTEKNRNPSQDRPSPERDQRASVRPELEKSNQDHQADKAGKIKGTGESEKMGPDQDRPNAVNEAREPQHEPEKEHDTGKQSDQGDRAGEERDAERGVANAVKLDEQEHVLEAPHIGPGPQAEQHDIDSSPRPWTPEEREAKIAEVKAAREAREAREAMDKSLDNDDPGRGI